MGKAKRMCLSSLLKTQVLHQFSLLQGQETNIFVFRKKI